MAIATTNPATGEIVKTFDELSDEQIEAKIQLAHKTYDAWRKLPLADKSKHMMAIADKLDEKQEEYAQLLTLEMGKPITQARAEVAKCAWNFRHYAEHSEGYLQPKTIETDASKSYVTYQPLGVILNVMPWNFAFWQAFRMAAPILMAGNTIVLKHASNVPQSALIMEELMLEAGLPEGVYQTLLVGSSKVEQIIAHDHVRGASLTGSEYAGRMVGSQAGKAIKPVVLELGGSDPSIILEDADLTLACDLVSSSRLLNNGQSCIGSKRFIVVDAIYDEFLDGIQTIFENYTVGDPTKDATMMGPVVSEQALEELLKQIDDSVQAGAKILTGGKRHGETGSFLQPTILTNVTKDVPSYSEEIFGPVASIIRVKDEKEAIAVANDSRFGLGASIYSKDSARAEKLAQDIEAGSVFINGLVKSDPRLPFGGIKTSGVGRELGEEGIKAFTNTKTIWVK